MGRRKVAPPPRADTGDGQPDRLDDQALQVLLKEYDALRELFSQAESSVQNIFNFYLTLVTAVGGAIVVIWQVTRPGNPDAEHASQLITAGLLLFVAIVGSVYLSSITGRYAHMDRYAQGIDHLRRYLLQHTGGALPDLYKSFMTQTSRPRQSRAAGAVSVLMWVTPTGTYQLFVAAVNSLGLAASVWLFLTATSVVAAEPARSVITCLIIALVNYGLYNIYSRYIKNRLITRLTIQVDTSSEAAFVTD